MSDDFTKLVDQLNPEIENTEDVIEDTDGYYDPEEYDIDRNLRVKAVELAVQFANNDIDVYTPDTMLALAKRISDFIDTGEV